MLNVNVSTDEMDQVYVDDYYWYLKCQNYIDLVVKPMAKIINDFGGRCVDIGCGEAPIAAYLDVPYFGIDVSRVAISNARKNMKDRQRFEVCRFEEFVPTERFDTVLFSNILQVLVQPEFIPKLVMRICEAANAQHLIVCEIATFEPTILQEVATLESVTHIFVPLEGKNIVPIKKQRLIAVYSCK